MRRNPNTTTAMNTDTHGDHPSTTGMVMRATMSKPRMRLNISPGGMAPAWVATIGEE